MLKFNAVQLSKVSFSPLSSFGPLSNFLSYLLSWVWTWWKQSDRTPNQQEGESSSRTWHMTYNLYPKSCPSMASFQMYFFIFSLLFSSIDYQMHSSWIKPLGLKSEINVCEVLYIFMLFKIHQGISHAVAKVRKL